MIFCQYTTNNETHTEMLLHVGVGANRCLGTEITEMQKIEKTSDDMVFKTTTISVGPVCGSKYKSQQNNPWTFCKSVWLKASAK